MGEPEDNERPSREDGDSLNSDDGSGEYAALGAYTYIRDRRADPDDESLKDYTACSPEKCGCCGHCPY